MDVQQESLNKRLRNVAAVKSHNRKVFYTLFAVAVTSLVVAVARL